MINKQKYDTIRSKFQRNQFSENVSSHQRIVSELHSKLNDPKFWILTKFRNGVRVFERVNPKQSSGALSAVKSNSFLHHPLSRAQATLTPRIHQSGGRLAITIKLKPPLPIAPNRFERRIWKV